MDDIIMMYKFFLWIQSQLLMSKYKNSKKILIDPMSLHKKSLDIILKKGKGEGILKNAGLTDDDCQYLAQKLSNEITILNISNNQLTYQTFLYFKQKPWVSLVQVDLSFNSIGNKGVKLMTKSLWLENIQILQMRFANISNQGISHLNKFIFRVIKVLNISYNHFNSHSIEKLIKMQSKELESLLILGELLPNEKYRISREAINLLTLGEWINVQNIIVNQIFERKEMFYVLKLLGSKFTALKGVSANEF